MFPQKCSPHLMPNKIIKTTHGLSCSQPNLFMSIFEHGKELECIIYNNDHVHVQEYYIYGQSSIYSCRYDNDGLKHGIEFEKELIKSSTNNGNGYAGDYMWKLVWIHGKIISNQIKVYCDLRKQSIVPKELLEPELLAVKPIYIKRKCNHCSSFGYEAYARFVCNCEKINIHHSN